MLVDLVILAEPIVFGRHPHRFLYGTLIRGEIDRPAALRARDRIMRFKPAKDFFEAMTALWLAADEIEQPEIEQADARRRCQRHAGLFGNGRCIA